MANKTSLELILEVHQITRHALLKEMGFTYKNNRDTEWYQKFAGQRKITQEELDLILNALKRLGINEKVSYLVDKYVLV